VFSSVVSAPSVVHLFFAANEEVDGLRFGSLRAVASHEFVHGIDQRIQAPFRVRPGFR
jgi:hypothetical protein